jgi:UDP:flavonoid glycosyltransferase YjiC (YdhE family)
MGKRSPHLGRAANTLAWQVFAWGSGQVLYDRRFNAMRRSFGLPPIHGIALKSWMSAARTVMLVSRHYYPEAAADWPPMTWGGFSAWVGPPDRQSNPEIDAFIDGGAPPLVVTLGSSAAAGAAQAFATMADGLDQLGLRSLLLVGDTRNLGSLVGRPGAFDFAPLGRVLPRCRMAVVSGALGTVAAVLSAGLPVVVVPQLFDQVWHGGRIEDLGVGLMVWRAKDVARAVERIEADASYRERAQQLATEMAGEDGASSLVGAVESVL